MAQRHLLNRSIFRAGVSASAILLAAPIAQAAEEPAPAPDPAEIVVTAQKREQNLLDVPLAVQAVSGDTLERQGTKEIDRLVDFVPGASVVSKSAPGFETIQIRGVASGTVGDATVGYYIDDVVFSIPNLQLSPPSRLVDLQRVEVLRGPQGTLYGNGSMGGLIRLITSDPDTKSLGLKAQGEVSGTDGGGANYAGDAAVNIPLAADVAGLRVSGGYEHLSGFGRNSTGTKLNDTDSWNLRGNLLLMPTEGLKIKLSVWHMDAKQAYGNGFVSAEPAILPEPYGIDPFIQTIATFYSGSIKWDLGGVSLQSGTSYIDHKLKIDTITPSVLLSFPVGIRNLSTFGTRSFSQELRLVSDNKSPFQWIVGGIYTNGRIASDIDVNIRGLGAPIPFLVTRSTDADSRPLRTKNYALFGEASYELFDGKLIPLVGLRYFHDDRSAAGTTSYLGTPIYGAGANTYNSVSPRFNLTFKPNKDTTIYGNIARGFRSGTIQTTAQVLLAQATGLTKANAVVAPDSLWTYELGGKFRLAGGTLLLDIAGYYTDWKNIQIPFNTIGGVPAVVNGGNARIKGIDLGLTWRTPLTGLSLQAVANINDATFRRVDPALAAALPTAQNGAKLPNVPKGNFTIAATYAGKLSERVRLNLYGAYAYRDRQQDLASGLYSANISQLTARAGVEFEKFRIEVFGDNLLNEHGPTLTTATAVQPLYPRRIGVSGSVKF